MKQNSSPPNSFYVVVLLSTFLQGSSFVATKVVLHDVAPLWLASLRFLLAALSLLPLLLPQLLKYRQTECRNFTWLKIALIGLLQTTGVMAFLTMGLMSAPAPISAILMASNPLLVALLAGFLLNEPVRRNGWIGLGLAFVGVVICIGPAAILHGGVGTGECLVMAASACWAISTLVQKRLNLAMNPWIVSFWQMLIGALGLAIIALLHGDRFNFPVSAETWLAFLWLAIPASTGAMGLWFVALRSGGAVHTSGFLFLCPLFAAIIAFLVYGETVSLEMIGGGVLIAAGIVMVNASAKYRKAPAPSDHADFQLGGN